jgi:PAS domain S-box-containing protein
VAELGYVNVYGVDITERKQAVEALQESERRFRTVFERAGEPLYLIEPETGRFVDVNQRACDALGYTRQELLGLGVPDIDPVYPKEQFVEFVRTLKKGKPVTIEATHQRKDETTFPVEIRTGFVEIMGETRLLSLVRDISERKNTEAQQQLATKILARLNRKGERYDLVRDVLVLVKEALGFAAVAIRLRQGDDFPYFQVDGFSDAFVKSESHLCARDDSGELVRDSQGRPVVECMCGAVITGSATPALPCFTEGGTFWTNSTTELIESTSLIKKLGRVRSTCNRAGYESVALIPLRSGDEVVGLLQLNDTKAGRFTDEMIRFLEGICASIGIALARIKAEKALEWESQLNSTIAELSRALIESRSLDDVSSLVLDHAKRFTTSALGFVGHIDESTGALICPTMTRDVWDRCQVAEKSVVFEKFAGLWGWVLENKEPLLTNQPAGDPRSSGTPAGHLPIHRFLSAPALIGETLVGQVALANAERDYDQQDLELVERLASVYALAVQRHRAEKQMSNLAKFPSESPYPVVRIAKGGAILYANDPASILLDKWGCKLGGLAPQNWRQYVVRVLESGRGGELETTCEGRVFSLIIAPVVDAGYVNVYGIDVTERRQAEEDLRKYRLHLEDLVEARTAELSQTNEQLLEEIERRHRLEREILEISESERRRIGRELHDSIGQQFTGIAFMTKVLEKRLAKGLPEESASAAEIGKLVNQATDQVRGLARGLYSVDLDAGGLASSLAELAANTEHLFGIHCSFQGDDSVHVDDTSVAVNLYRIAQEAVTNAVKHGKAKNIRITLTCRDGKYVLTVENDGEGFPGTEAGGKGLGLQIMGYRAEIIDGSLELASGAKGGTIVTCSLPRERAKGSSDKPHDGGQTAS